MRYVGSCREWMFSPEGARHRTYSGDPFPILSDQTKQRPHNAIAQLVLIILGMFLSETMVTAQTLRREDEGIRYRVGKVVASISKVDWTGWIYHIPTHMCIEFERVESCPLGSFSAFYSPVAYTIRTAIMGSDTVTVMGVQSKGPSDLWQVLVIDADSIRQDMLGFMDSLKSSNDSTYSPGVRTFKTLVMASTYMEDGDETDYDNVLRSAETPGNDIIVKDFGFALFPVKIDGVSSIRFVFGTPSQQKYSKNDFTPECFDYGYYEIPFEKFRAFIAEIQ